MAVAPKVWSLAYKKRMGLIPQFWQQPSIASNVTPPAGAYSVDVTHWDSWNIDPTKSGSTKTYSNATQYNNGVGTPIQKPENFLVPKGQTYTWPSYSFQNKASKGQPVVFRPTVWTNLNKIPDYTDILQLDKKGLQDYIDMYDINSKKWVKITPQDEFKLRKAGQLLQEQSVVNPYEEIAKKAQADYEELKLKSTNDINSQAELKKAQLDAKFQQDQAQIQRQWERVKQATQSALSFSGFGRSTFNAEKQAEIQSNVEWTINSLAQAKDLEYQKYMSELQWASAEQLWALSSQIAWLQAQSKQFIVDSAYKINQEQGQLWMDAQSKIENIIKLANSIPSQSFESMDKKTQKEIDNYAKSVINTNGDIDENLLKMIPAALLPTVLQRAGETRVAPANGDYQFLEADKFNPARIFDKKTGKIIRDPAIVAQYAPWGMWGGSWVGGWAAWTGTPWASEIDYSWLTFKNQEQSQAFWYATRMIDAEKIFQQTEPLIAWTSTIKWTLQRNLPSFAQSDTFRQQEQAERNFINAVLRRESGAAISPTEFDSAKKQYFPQPWDDTTTLSQKKQNRATVMQGIAAMTGKTNAAKILPVVQNVISGNSATTPAPVKWVAPVKSKNLDDLWNNL